VSFTRVAFTFISPNVWTGGYNYLLNLLSAINDYTEEDIQPVLFYGEDIEEKDLKAFLVLPNIEVVESKLFERSAITSRLVKTILFGIDKGAVQCFKENNIDVVFETATYFGWRNPIPVLAWMPDFQHRNLPQQFDKKAYWRRDIGFRLQVLTSKTILLSSNDAREDCESYYPKSIGKTSVLHFPAPIDPKLLSDDTVYIVKEYGLPKSFIYLPNQFWTHKNHALVIDALAILKKKGGAPVIVSTGNQTDPRNPEYFESIKNKISKYNLEENFYILGMIPRADVIALMQTCTALINPSLCEGWSSTVEEGRSLGVPMLLSSLDVHIEQMKSEAIYFNPEDASDLADKMEKYSGSPPLQPRPISEKNELSRKKFANEFKTIIKNISYK